MLVVPRTQALSGEPSTSGAEAAVEVLIGTAMGSGSEGEAFRCSARCAALGLIGRKFVFRRRRGSDTRTITQLYNHAT